MALLNLANITLQMLGRSSDKDNYNRELLLSSTSPSLTIGRASRRHEHRGKPAADNATFESPVISREHARLWLENKRLMIEDLDSLHGTSVNGEKLPIKTCRELRSGDRITIGSDVSHGDRKIMAREFAVNFGFSKQRCDDRLSLPNFQSTNTKPPLSPLLDPPPPTLPPHPHTPLHHTKNVPDPAVETEQLCSSKFKRLSRSTPDSSSIAAARGRTFTVPDSSDEESALEWQPAPVASNGLGNSREYPVDLSDSVDDGSRSPSVRLVSREDALRPCHRQPYAVSEDDEDEVALYAQVIDKDTQYPHNVVNVVDEESDLDPGEEVEDGPDEEAITVDTSEQGPTDSLMLNSLPSGSLVDLVISSDEDENDENDGDYDENDCDYDQELGEDDPGEEVEDSGIEETENQLSDYAAWANAGRFNTVDDGATASQSSSDASLYEQDDEDNVFTPDGAHKFVSPQTSPATSSDLMDKAAVSIIETQLPIETAQAGIEVQQSPQQDFGTGTASRELPRPAKNLSIAELISEEPRQPIPADLMFPPAMQHQHTNAPYFPIRRPLPPAAANAIFQPDPWYPVNGVNHGSFNWMQLRDAQMSHPPPIENSVGYAAAAPAGELPQPDLSTLASFDTTSVGQSTLRYPEVGVLGGSLSSFDLRGLGEPKSHAGGPAGKKRKAEAMAETKEILASLADHRPEQDDEDSSDYAGEDHRIKASDMQARTKRPRIELEVAAPHPVAAVAVAAADRPNRRRARSLLRTAGTLAAGMFIGGVGMVGALAALPDMFVA